MSNLSELAAAQDKLLVITQKVVSLEEQLAKLTADFEKATADKVVANKKLTQLKQQFNLLIGSLVD